MYIFGSKILALTSLPKTDLELNNSRFKFQIACLFLLLFAENPKHLHTKIRKKKKYSHSKTITLSVRFLQFGSLREWNAAAGDQKMEVRNETNERNKKNHNGFPNTNFNVVRSTFCNKMCSTLNSGLLLSLGIRMKTATVAAMCTCTCVW